MADLTNTSVNQTLGKVLTTVADLSGTLSTVQSVNGQASALQISSSTVNINGTFKVGAFTVTVPATVTFGGTFSTGSTFSTMGTFSTGGNFSTTSTVSITGAFSTAAAFTTSGANALTLTTTGSTNVTLPTSGTLYGTASGSITSAQLATSLSDETGSGSVVFATSPTITTPIIAQINDTNGNASLKFTTTASAVNQFTSANAATGGAPTLSVTGTDTNINMFFQAKGNGTYRFLGTSTNPCSIQLNTTNNSNLYTLAAPSSLGANRGATLPDSDIGCFVIQRVSTETGAVATGTTTIPFDDTIPQNTEGDQYMSLAITPKNTANILRIDVVIHLTTNAAGNNILTGVLCQDSTANSLAAGMATSTLNGPMGVKFTHIMTAGTTSSTTFKVRGGCNAAGTTTFNGQAGGRIYGGVLASSIVITEYSS